MIIPADMSAIEVHTVLDALATVGCRSWIGGGWGVDALVGHQTRPTVTWTSRSPQITKAMRYRLLPGSAIRSKPTGARCASKSPPHEAASTCTR